MNNVGSIPNDTKNQLLEDLWIDIWSKLTTLDGAFVDAQVSVAGAPKGGASYIRPFEIEIYFPQRRQGALQLLDHATGPFDEVVPNITVVWRIEMLIDHDLDSRFQQRFLRGPPAIDRGSAYPCSLSNRVQCQVVESNLGCQRNRGIQDLLGKVGNPRTTSTVLSIQACHIVILPALRKGRTTPHLASTAVGAAALTSRLPRRPHRPAPAGTAWSEA